MHHPLFYLTVHTWSTTDVLSLGDRRPVDPDAVSGATMPLRLPQRTVDRLGLLLPPSRRTPPRGGCLHARACRLHHDEAPFVDYWIVLYLLLGQPPFAKLIRITACITLQPLLVLLLASTSSHSINPVSAVSTAHRPSCSCRRCPCSRPQSCLHRRGSPRVTVFLAPTTAIRTNQASAERDSGSERCEPPKCAAPDA